MKKISGKLPLVCPCVVFVAGVIAIPVFSIRHALERDKVKVQRELQQFGSTATVVELNHYRETAIMQNENGDRIRIFVHHDQLPIVGDMWSLKKENELIRLDRLVRSASPKIPRVEQIEE